MTDFCEQRIYAASSDSLTAPAEYCGNDVEPGETFCAEHLLPDVWDQADEAYTLAKEGWY